MSQIVFYEVPSVILVPGVYAEANYRLAMTNVLPTYIQNLMLIGQRLQARIEPARFQGGTLNDMTSQGTYVGTVKTDILVEIDAADTPDTFKWSKDGGATWEVETVAVTGSAQTLENGITITFAATTGHAIGDQWLFGAWPEPSVAEKIPTQVWSDGEVAEMFGYSSMLHLMAKAMINANRRIELHVCALEDAGAGVQATGTVTIAGTVTVAGNLKFYIGDKLIEINVANDDTAAAVAIALQNEIANYLDQIPVDAAVNTGTPGQIDITAKHKGVVGNQIGLAYEMTASGITVTIVAMASGATDPDIDDATDAAAAGDYAIYVTPYNDSTSLGKLAVHLDEVSGPTEKRFVIGVFGNNGVLATIISQATSLNHGRLNVSYMPNTRSTPYKIAATYAAMIASRPDAVWPMNNYVLKGIHAPAITDRLTEAEKESLLSAGVTPLYVGDGETVQVVRAVTTYTKKSGVPDISKRELGTITGMDYVMRVSIARLALRFASAKNTARTKKEIRSLQLATLYMLQDAEIVQNVTEYKDLLIVEDDNSDPNRVNMQIPIFIVGALHVIAMRFDLYLR